MRLLVVLYLLLATASVVAGSVLPASPLPEVQEAVAAIDADSFAWVDALPGLGQLAVTGAALLFLALTVAGAVGLYFYRRWGRTLSVATTILAYALLPFVGASIEGPIEGLLYDLATLAWGGALALAYWSSTAERFSTATANRGD